MALFVLNDSVKLQELQEGKLNNNIHCAECKEIFLMPGNLNMLITMYSCPISSECMKFHIEYATATGTTSVTKP